MIVLPFPYPSSGAVNHLVDQFPKQEYPLVHQLTNHGDQAFDQNLVVRSQILHSVKLGCHDRCLNLYRCD